MNKKILWALSIAAIAIGFAYHAAGHPMDFRVYHFGARGVFEGTRPVYGPTSGLGWPMHYRYPPLFLLLFAPFAMLPLGWGAAVWVILKIGVLVWLAKAILQRSQTPQPLQWVVPCVFLIGPYVVEELRYGNAQFFIFALTAAALMASRTRPVVAASSLALAISIKIWPFFFVPYLAVRRDWKMVSYTLLFVVILALIPSLYFGVRGNARLLGEWFNQEFHTQLSENEIWFPNQSLRGVLMRYQTFVDYSQVPDGNYPQVNIVAISPAAIRALWMIVAGLTYAGFLLLVRPGRPDLDPFDYALGFCLVALLEPFSQKYALSILLWPALAAGGFMKNSGIRMLIYSAAVFALVQPLAPGAGTQRMLQVLGFDFAAATLLTAAILTARSSRSITTV